MKPKYTFLEETENASKQQKMKNNEYDWLKILKFIFAVLLLLCWLPFPYGYFMFIRWASMVFFAFLAFQEYEAGNKNTAFLYLALALLFQPFVKIALGRSLWNIVDTAVAGWLIVSLVRNNKK